MDRDAEKVTVAVSKDLFSQRIREAGLDVDVQVFPFKIEGSPLRRFWNMWGFLRKLRPDRAVFFLNGFFQFLLPSFLAAYFQTRGQVYAVVVLAPPKPSPKIPKKYFGVVPALNLWWYKSMLPIRWRAALTKKILVASKELKTLLVDWYGYPASKVYPVYHGISPSKLQVEKAREALRAELGIAPTDKVFVTHGRLSPQKRLDRMLNVFADFCKDHHDLRLFLVGDGEMEQGLKKLADEKHISQKVTFTGFTTKTADYLNMADYFLLSSDSEGLCRAMVEAMMLNRVCIATRVTGPNEVITDGETGFLADVSEEGLKDGIRRAMALSPEGREMMLEKAREKAFGDFNFERNIVKELEVLDLRSGSR